MSPMHFRRRSARRRGGAAHARPPAWLASLPSATALLASLAVLACCLPRAAALGFRALPKDAHGGRPPTRDEPPGAELDRAGESVWHLRAKREASPPPQQDADVAFRPIHGSMNMELNNASHPRLLQVSFWGGTGTGSCGSGVTLPSAGTGSVSCTSSGSLPQTCECIFTFTGGSLLQLLPGGERARGGLAPAPSAPWTPKQRLLRPAAAAGRVPLL